MFYSKFLPRFMRLALSYNFINALAKNSPPDCFLYARLRVLLSLCLYNKKEHRKVFFFMVRQQYSCFILNFCLVLCGLLLVIISSTLSLKTVHRTVFFTLAFESLLSLCLYNKKEHRKVFFLWCANRDSNPGPTGYEPVALTN